MSQTVWQVRKKGKVYGPGMSQNVEAASPHPFDEFVGAALPADFDGEVVRKVEFEVPKYNLEGWVPHVSQKDHMEMYGGGDSGN